MPDKITGKKKSESKINSGVSERKREWAGYFFLHTFLFSPQILYNEDVFLYKGTLAFLKKWFLRIHLDENLPL